MKVLLGANDRQQLCESQSWGDLLISKGFRDLEQWIISREGNWGQAHVFIETVMPRGNQPSGYVWGQGGTNQTPLFARWAGNVLRALYEKKLTLVEAEYRQFPMNDSRWKPLKTQNDTRTLEYRITPGTPVRSAEVDITRRKAVGMGFFAREKTLSSATPSLADSGVKAGPRWPSELEPTRFGKFPPDDYGSGSGNIATDTIYPIEDVMYRIEPGWNVRPFSDNGGQIFEVARTPGGFRMRPSNPDNPIFVKFKMTRIQNRNTVPQNGSQISSGNPYWNSAQNPPVNQPAVRPYVVPNKPSYYPTRPSGPSYYPTKHNP